MIAPIDSSPFQEAFRAIVSFCERRKIPYFVLGGVAVGVLGEPRFTYDVDLDIQLSKDAAEPFLRAAKKEGFRIDVTQATKDIAQFGTFRMAREGVQIDCILASTPLETEVFRRRKRRKLFGLNVYLPSVEDLLLLKIIPGREKDLLDAKSLVARHKGKLDKRYLEKWIQALCDEAEDYRFMRILQELLK